MINEKAYLAQTRAALAAHFDANETLFLEREITQFRAKMFEVQFPELKARTFLPKANDIASSAPAYAYKILRPLGKAKLIAHKANDLPRVDMDATEATGVVHSIGASFGWDLNEMREAARLGVPLSSVKAQVANKAIARAIDEIIAFGALADAAGNRPTTGLQGFVNNADVVSGTVLDGTYWLDTTPPDPADVLQELGALVRAIAVDSKDVFGANSLLLPTAHYNFLKQTPFSDLSGESILSVFMKNNPELSLVAPWNVLDAAGATGKPRVIAYQKDPSVAEAVIPQEFEMLPPEAEGLEMVVACHARCGGTKTYQPLAIKYMDMATSA